MYTCKAFSVISIVDLCDLLDYLCDNGGIQVTSYSDRHVLALIFCVDILCGPNFVKTNLYGWPNKT